MERQQKIDQLQVTGNLRLEKNAVMTVVNSDQSESTVNLLELAALDGIAAADLAKIDGITNGTGAAGKALVLDSSGNVAMPDNGAIALSRAAVAAAGSTAADATVLADQVNAVTASDGAKGVALPAAATTTGPIYVINTVLTSGANLLVYPVNGGNDNINGGAEDAAFTMGPGKAAWFIPTSATQWYVEDAAGVLTTTTEANILDGVTATATEINRACDVSARVVSVTTTPLTLTEAAHDGKLVVLNKADGATLTLPAATGSGSIIHVVVGTTVTSNAYIVQVANATDVMDGMVHTADDTATPVPGVWVTAADSDTVTLNGSTKGGIIGDELVFTDIATNQWMVRGFLKQSGIEATPFSAAVV